MTALNPTISFNGGTTVNPNPLKGFGYVKPWGFDLTESAVVQDVVVTTQEGSTLLPFGALYYKPLTYDRDLNCKFYSSITLTSSNIRTKLDYDPETVSYTFEVLNMDDDVFDEVPVDVTTTNNSITINTGSGFGEEKTRILKTKIKLYVDGSLRLEKTKSVTLGLVINEFEILKAFNGVTAPINNAFDWALNSISGTGIRSLFTPLFNTIVKNNLVAGNGTQKLFSISDHSTPSYQRNANFLLSDYDFTGVCVWNSRFLAGQTPGATPISPRHVLMANHYPVYNGEVVRYVTSDNQVVERTIVSQSRVGDDDIKIGLLNEDLPETIKYYKIWDWHDNPYQQIFESPFSPFNFPDWGHIPLIMFDQYRKIYVLEMRNSPKPRDEAVAVYTPRGSFGEYSSSDVEYRKILTSNELDVFFDMRPFSITPRGGDSGNPVFVLINGEPILVCAFFTNGYSPMLATWKYKVNETMASLGDTPYQLTEITEDAFSNYPTFSRTF